MNVFELRNRVIGDYKRYVESFLNIQDERIREFVNSKLDEGHLWPDALVQLNPSYEMGKTVSQLVSEKELDPLCGQIFKKGKESFHLYHHQEQAIRAAAKKEPYILTTGTGSGKSLTYLIPIIDHILKNEPEPEQVRALIVYPMNALINSQKKAIEELLGNLGEGQSPIRFGRYTGQDSSEERSKLQQHPPHILLTNYVMLELMMSRPAERVFLDRTLTNLEFLVLDELHTYTGRRGADVSMLVRRVRQRCGNDNLLCIATSATMVAGGTHEEQRQKVAQVASKMFGVNVSPQNVIDERLKRSIQCSGEPSANDIAEYMNKGFPEQYEDFLRNPLAVWIEENFGIERQQNFYRRRTPISLTDGAQKLVDLTGFEKQFCEKKIRQYLHIGSKLRHPDGSPVFAVRLNQFISQGDSVYSTLERPDTRYFTLIGQRYTSGDNETDRLLIPLVFCRVCGQEYYQVTRVKSDSKHLEPLTPTELDEQGQQYLDDGYLLIDDEQKPVWKQDRIEELPENWFRDPERKTKIKKEYLDHIPQQIYVTPDGIYSEDPRENAVVGWFLKAPFLTCLKCGEVYDKRRSEYSKLSRLSSEGRSTATTLLSISTVTQLRQEKSLESEVQAQKILSFTDNRQDASLQSGHFNDFVQVGLFRSAIFRTLKQNEYLDHSNIATEVVKTLNLSADEYAQNPGEIGAQPRRNREALTAYIEYLIYQDLRRGWRIIQPNLEQCGLLEIEYDGLEEVCNSDDHWQQNSILSQATPENRFKVAKAFLDHLRRALALDAHRLNPVEHESLKRKVNNTLKDPWNFDAEERLEEWKWFRLGQRYEEHFSLSPISVIGKYLRSRRAWPFLSVSLNTDDYKLMLRTLVKLLFNAGYLKMDIEEKDFRLQLRVDSFQWVKGDGILQVYDPVRSVRMTTDSEESIRHQANRFFTQFYKDEAARLHRLEGREHTGQTNPELREDREIRFRSGDLSCLFCSPTMELGIDIADLVTVNMRNVPPSPANYAQRSGRAGRAGQPALITTYCSTGSGHDQYFFNRKEEMVAGVVVPPRLDLSNQELIESHIHAVWLAHVGISLKDSIAEILDLNQKELPLLDNIKQQIHLSENKIIECLKACQSIINQCKEDLEKAVWYSEEWLESVVRSAPVNFDESFKRWRELYNMAHQQLIDSQEKLRHAHQLKLSRAEKNELERLEREARHQKDLLCNQVKNRDHSDFYPYRYLASEGFLPGYNFPRLPVRAYIQRGKDKGEFFSRGRFLAISEFGPRNILYHEGSKFTVYRSFFPLGGPDSRFTQVKICKRCGTFHTGEHLKFDVCQHCHATLDGNNSDYITNLFEMTTIATQRRDRITCNEEDRIRKGYEISTHFRFSIQDGKESKYVAEALDTEGNTLLELNYGPAADIWRINKKWRRSRDVGYTLELTLGIWGKKKEDYEDTALDAGEDNLRHRVQLFVRDARNVLLIKPTSANPLQEAELSNLQYALHKAICAIFQVDESEIASERIGRDEHRAILFWEAAEGGVGVLQRLVEDPDALRNSASRALEICHFDSETGNQLQDGEDCARACYHCLLTYYNQRDHNILNRNLIKDLLLRLSQCDTKRGYETRNYDEHYHWLRNLTDSRSELEKKFLDQLYRDGRRLPDEAQKLLSDLPSRPDYYYKEGYVCVFCDGSVHDATEQQKEDQQIRSQLRSSGFRVVVIRYDRPLDEQIAENEDIFGVVKK